MGTYSSFITNTLEEGRAISRLILWRPLGTRLCTFASFTVILQSLEKYLPAKLLPTDIALKKIKITKFDTSAYVYVIYN